MIVKFFTSTFCNNFPRRLTIEKCLPSVAKGLFFTGLTPYSPSFGDVCSAKHPALTSAFSI
jgi:hypothetical protein